VSTVFGRVILASMVGGYISPRNVTREMEAIIKN
jgi:hypothetical protein